MPATRDSVIGIGVVSRSTPLFVVRCTGANRMQAQLRRMRDARDGIARPTGAHRYSLEVLPIHTRVYGVVRLGGVWLNGTMLGGCNNVNATRFKCIKRARTCSTRDITDD